MTQWYRLGPNCGSQYDAAGLVAGSTIAGVRHVQDKVLKTGYYDAARDLFFPGAPPIVPAEWFMNARDMNMFLAGGIIEAYEPTDGELYFAYTEMYPGLKPADFSYVPPEPEPEEDEGDPSPSPSPSNGEGSRELELADEENVRPDAGDSDNDEPPPKAVQSRRKKEVEDDG